MVDCKINIEKKDDPKGDRVLLSFEYVVCLTCRLERLCFGLVESSAHLGSGKYLYATSPDIFEWSVFKLIEDER